MDCKQCLVEIQLDKLFFFKTGHLEGNNFENLQHCHCEV